MKELQKDQTKLCEWASPEAQNSGSACWSKHKSGSFTSLDWRLTVTAQEKYLACGLLYIVDILINTSTEKQTEQNGQLCWSNQNVLVHFINLSTVLVSHPLIQKNHKHNLSRREKKKWWKSLL